MTSPESARPRSVREVKSWDYQADVVVVGFGGGGSGAALESARAGADTLVLERAGGRGGATFMSGGYVYTGGGTALQKACGFEDTPEEMYKFPMAAPGPNFQVTDDIIAQAELYSRIITHRIPFSEALDAIALAGTPGAAEKVVVVFE